MIEIWAMMQNKISLLTSKGFTFSWFAEKQITIPTTTVLRFAGRILLQTLT
jgi:hypothetical protein